MSQSNHSVGNVSAPVFRSDMNASLQALASLNSGATAPSTTYGNMLWYDTANNILKMRSEADDAWINVAYFDQTANAFRILDDTQLVNTSGTQTGLLGDQATATWESGVATTESLVSPAKVKASVASFRNDSAVGWGQTWQDVTGLRAANVSYQNTTTRPIGVSTFLSLSSPRELQVSADNINWVATTYGNPTIGLTASCIVVPVNHYYRVNGTGTVNWWSELR